ncbi:hypothetical protein BC940DRAFT_305356 [Gongronella butleri]|nr:hypothetical protein BC940DRAFT_305356 [Gongronella butleri]
MKSCAKHLVNSLDDVRHLVALHKTIQRATPAPTLPFEFAQARGPTLPRKRRPSIDSIA